MSSNVGGIFSDEISCGSANRAFGYSGNLQRVTGFQYLCIILLITTTVITIITIANPVKMLPANTPAAFSTSMIIPLLLNTNNILYNKKGCRNNLFDEI